jgi:hypothetical protein
LLGATEAPYTPGIRRVASRARAVGAAQGEAVKHCDCCDRDVDEGKWDGLYTACHDCAWEQSLEHWPCDHGAERRSTSAPTAEQIAKVRCPDCGLTGCAGNCRETPDRSKAE